MKTTTYMITTPCGAFDAVWADDEDEPVRYAGNPDAQAYFDHYLELKLVTGAGGRRLSMATLEPSDAFKFCQSEEFSILVMPEPDDMIALLVGEMLKEAGDDSHPLGTA